MSENSNFPNDNISPIEKANKKYGVKVGQTIMATGVRAEHATDRVKKIKENREYASNNQSVDQYKPLLNAAIDTKGMSLMNIDWSISTPAKKMIDTVVGGMLNQDHKIQFNSISPYSRTKREKDRDAFFMQIVMDRDMAAIEEEAGIVLKEKKNNNPKDADEIDLYMDMEYRQPIEIGMEEIVDFELYNNDWEKKHKIRVIKDLVENSEGHLRIYFDENDKIRLRYVDLENYYAPATSEPDLSDVDYEAELVLMTIRELKLRDTKQEITKEQWDKLAIANSSQNGNPYFNGYDKGYNYDDFRVQVLDFVWYTTDQTYWEERINKNGRLFFDKKSWGYTSEKSNVIIKEKEVSYEGLYIPKIEIVLQYGLSKNMLRHKDEYKTDKVSPKLVRRYINYKIKGKSIVDVMKPNLDNIQLLVLRKRHIISEINPTGVAIDVAGINDVLAILKETEPMKIVSTYKQKGILFYSRTDVNGEPSNGIPIQELTSPFAQLLLSLDQSIISEVNIIRENIGINDSRDGSSPNKDALVGIEKLKLLASNNVTRELYNAYLNGIFAPIGKVISRMVQYKVVYGGGIGEYEDVIGKIGVKSLEFAKDVEMAELGIKIEALPTADDIQDLLNMLNLSLQNQEIRPEDYLAVKSILNVKKATRFLMQRRKKIAEEKMLEFQQKEQITAEREKASAMGAAEAAKMRAMAEAEAKAMLLQTEYNLKKEFDNHTTNNKIKIVDRESYWDMKKIEKAKEMESDNDDNKESGGLDAANTVRVFSDPERAATRTDTMIS